MASFGFSSTSGKPTVVITGIETPIGQQLARQLARVEFPAWVGAVRGLYSEPNQNDLRPVIDWLAIQGMEPLPVNYNDVSSIESGLRNADYLVLCPPMLQNSPQSTVQEFQRILTAAKNANIRNLIIMSWIGAEMRPEQQWLGVFAELEKSAKEMFTNASVVVLRVNFGSQNLRLIAPKVRAEQQLNIPITNSSAQWTPVDFDDVARVVASLIKGERNIPASYKGQVYQLTGPQTPAMTPKLVCDILNEIAKSPAQQRASGNQGKISLRSDLSRDAFQTSVLTEMRRVNQEWNKIYNVGGTSSGQQYLAINTAAGPYYLTPAYAGLVADLWELVSVGKLNVGPGDVQKLTGIPPVPMERFLREYAIEFKPQQQ